MKKILVIEDDNHIRESICELLEIKEYEVSSATDGRDGIAKARKIIPDMIICDIMMPGMNGYEVLAELMKDKEMSIIPFIFLSALSAKDDIREGMNLGADDYLTKPFKAQELYNAIEARFKKRTLEANQSPYIEPLKTNNVQRGLIDPIEGIIASTRIFKKYFSDSPSPPPINQSLLLVLDEQTDL